MNSKATYRAATAADSRFIAAMIDVASDGVALIEWTETAQRTPALNPLDVGAAQYASKEGDYSYRNCWRKLGGRPSVCC